MISLGERLKQLREERGLKQKYVAHKAGMHQNTLSELELGNSFRAKEWTIKKLAEFFEMTPEQLMEGVVIYEMGLPWVVRKEDCCGSGN